MLTDDCYDEVAIMLNCSGSVHAIVAVFDTFFFLFFFFFSSHFIAAWDFCGSAVHAS